MHFSRRRGSSELQRRGRGERHHNGKGSRSLKVVSDTSPIIAFSNLGKLHILKSLFGRITIPHAVYEELSEGKSFQLEDWIQVEVIKDRGLYKMLRSSLDHGESEAMR